MGDQKVVCCPASSNSREIQSYKFSDNILDKHVSLIIPSSKVFDKLGYEYLGFPDEASEPEYADVKFCELIPEFMTADGRAREIADKNLYKHQFETIRALSEGKNVILISGTGSGKTEAWAIYALKNRLRVLAVYPTLALSQDQIDRLRSYYAVVGLREAVVEVDRPLIDKLGNPKKARELISRALLVITNPAFLMADVKRLASGVEGRSRSILLDFLRDVDLIIIDELDYYGSKGATLLLALIEILENYVCSKRPQVIALTATLGNPEELKQYLSQISGRDTEIIEGRAFKVRNFIYLVLGKNLKKIWSIIQNNKAEIENKIPEITPLIRDFETFRDNIFNVIELLREHGFNIPELGLDTIEILAEYVKSNEKCVTVVFTPSIRSAETLAKKLRTKLKEETKLPDEMLSTIIVTHHHLIDADKRRRIEELARQGKVKIIFTVRTLLQGIDIGTIARIVHYGLPEDVREFKQREGRKGRRRELPFSETVIVPIRPWDKSLVELGIEGLKEYVSMPLENVFINPNNKYVLMFKALFKIRKYPNDLTEKERNLLEELELVKPVKGLLGIVLSVSERGKRIWRNINFYEFGLPYGVNRFLIDEQGNEVFIGNNVSWRDLVEKYQPGCFDYSNDVVVVKIRKRNSIVEQDILNAINRRRFLKEAYEQYYAVKRRWSEEPNILRDFISGKLTSIVQCYIRVPHNGFGEFVEESELVVWKIESRKPRVVKFDNEYRIMYESKRILLDSRVRGRYRDFTYGYMYELDPTGNVDNIHIGLALLKLILRLSGYRISLNELSYIVEEKPRKLMLIWENECSGIIESIDWNKVRRFIDEFKPCKICELLLWAIDEDVAVKVIENNIPWDEMKKYAHKVLDYIQGVLRLKLKGLGEVRVPKPSKEHKLLSLDIFPININDTIYYIVTSFDGEGYDQLVLDIHEKGKQLTFNTVNGVNRLLNVISEAIDEGFKVLIYGQKSQLQEMARNSRTLQILLKSLEDSNLIIDVHDMAKKALGLDIAPIEELEKHLNVQMRKSSLSQLRNLYHNAIVKGVIEEFLDEAKEYSKSNAYSTYIMYLIFSYIGQDKSRG